MNAEQLSKVKELEDELESTNDFMRKVEIKDEISLLTGDAERREAARKEAGEQQYECIGCSG